MTVEMTSNKPYLIRAFYDWIVDNDLTPYLAVDALYPNVMVPEQHINDGQIVLNVAPESVGGMAMSGEVIEFNARFGGKLEHLYVPFEAISAIYSRENGVGSSFSVEYPEDGLEPLEDVAVSKPEKKGKPSLSIVK
jgi:stringent starvation protein B